MGWGGATADGYEVFLRGDENALKLTGSDCGMTLDILKIAGPYNFPWENCYRM